MTCVYCGANPDQLEHHWAMQCQLAPSFVVLPAKRYLEQFPAAPSPGRQDSPKHTAAGPQGGGPPKAGGALPPRPSKRARGKPATTAPPPKEDDWP